MMTVHHDEEIRRSMPAGFAQPEHQKRNLRYDSATGVRSKKLNWNNPNTFNRMLDKSVDFATFRFAKRGRNILAPLNPKGHGITSRITLREASNDQIRLKRYLNTNSEASQINNVSVLEKRHLKRSGAISPRLVESVTGSQIDLKSIVSDCFEQS